MKPTIKSIFYDNPLLEEELTAFLARDPELSQAQRALYEAADQLAQIAGFGLYDAFEQRLWTYTARLSSLYYFFGLGLRQEVLGAMGAEGAPYSSSFSSLGSGGITGRSPSSCSK